MTSADALRAQERIEKAKRERSSELNLSNLGLKSVPALPPELKELRKLNLSSNRLKELSPQIYELTRLESLDIGNNRLSVLTPGVGQLANLEFLDVSENHLAVLPFEVRACTLLKELHLYRNQLTALFEATASFEHLVLLDVSKNRLQSLSVLDKKCPNLRDLDISNNQLDSLPGGIRNLRQLEVLNLSGNRIASVMELTRLSQLQELYLDDNLLAAVPIEIADFRNLKVFSAERNPFGALPGVFDEMRAAALRRDARAVLEAHVSGGPEPGKEYVASPTFKFDFSLAIGGLAGVLRVTDLYYKRADVAWPATLKFPDGAIVELNNKLSRKTAIKAVREHEASLRNGQALLDLGYAHSELREKYDLVLDAVSRLPTTELIPKMSGEQVIQFNNLDVIARYADAKFYCEDDAQDGTRAGALDPGRPLEAGRWYQLEIAVRQRRTGIPSTSDRPIREPKQSGPVKVLVTTETLAPLDFDIPEPASELTLPPTGDSSEQAYFRLRPKRVSTDPGMLSKIRVRLFYRLHLLEMFTMEAEVVETEATQSRLGLERPVYFSPERFCQTEPSDLDMVTPRKLHIEVDRRDNAYVLTFTTQVPGLEKIAVSGPAWLTPQQLEPIIVGARKTLMGIAASTTLAANVDGVDSEYQDQLAKLADFGSQLWTLLFRLNPQSALYKIGQWIEETPPADGSSIEVSITGNAADFVFPWALLYDRELSDQAPACEQGFWGLRYVIEQRITVRTAPEQPIPVPPLELGLLMWRFKQAKEQAAFLADLLSQAKATLAQGSPIMELATARKYLQNCAGNILYFFTHGHTQLPDADRYGFTEADFVALYERLETTSPLKEDWKYVYEKIKSRQYESDRSWIEVGRSADTDGCLYLQDLYSGIHTLAGRPIVILNMCESAQVTPSLSFSFIHFFLTRGARAVVGTECSMRPLYADYVGRQMIQALLQGDSVGTALLSIRQESVRRKNPLGLAYNVFGSVNARIEPALLAKLIPAASRSAQQTGTS